MSKYKKPVYSIFFHNYYGAHESWLNFFAANIKTSVVLYYNIVEDSIHNLEVSQREIEESIKRKSGFITAVVTRCSPNKGKDIGGKMVLMDAYLRLEMYTQYGLFLHDKKSPYKVNNQTWADKLLSVGHADFSEKTLTHFAKNTDTGIIAAEGTLIDELDKQTGLFRSNNSALLHQLLKAYNIAPHSYEYVAGTMFWARMKPFEKFFSNYTPLSILKTLEKGNVTDENAGTHTHCWERLFSWIVSGSNYSIKTV